MSNTPRLRLVKVASCPLCGKDRDQKYRPFCSKRCADIDMGRWLKEGYAIPAEELPEGVDSEDESGPPPRLK